MWFVWLLLLETLLLSYCCFDLLYSSTTKTVVNEGSHGPIRMVTKLKEQTGNSRTSKDPPVPDKPRTKRIAIFKANPVSKVWIEFKDLCDRMDEARRRNPSEKPVTARFFCPEHQCAIEPIETLEPDVLKQCDGVILNMDYLNHVRTVPEGCA